MGEIGGRYERCRLTCMDRMDGVRIWLGSSKCRYLKFLQHVLSGYAPDPECYFNPFIEV